MEYVYAFVCVVGGERRRGSEDEREDGVVDGDGDSKTKGTRTVEHGVVTWTSRAGAGHGHFRCVQHPVG